MNRELQPGLFPQVRRESEAPERPSQLPEEELKILAGQLEVMKRRLKDFESRIDMTNTRLTDFISAVKGKFERLTGASQALDEFVKGAVHDLGNKFSVVLSRVNERKLSETKVEQLIDRHQQLVNGFELRLNQLHKIINEQELQLTSSRAELKEAQRELARLKRL